MLRFVVVCAIKHSWLDVVWPFDHLESLDPMKEHIHALGTPEMQWRNAFSSNCGNTSKRFGVELHRICHCYRAMIL